VTITSDEMTRFLLSLEQAVDVIFAAVKHAKRGETYIPKVPASRVRDIVELLIGDRKIEISTMGIRPGEKVHEILVSEEEAHRTIQRGDYYVIRPILPELRHDDIEQTGSLPGEFSSENYVMTRQEVADLLERENLMVPDVEQATEELLR